jgi:hypothetical protein
MPLTDKIDTWTTAVFNLINANLSAAELQAVWFGDQDRYPTTPCASVEPGQKMRAYNGVPRMYLVDLNAYVTVYVERIQDTQQNRRDTLRIAEKVETVLHADATLGGLVIDSYVQSSDPGYIDRGKTILSACRLTFTGRSKVGLPHNP